MARMVCTICNKNIVLEQEDAACHRCLRRRNANADGGGHAEAAEG